MRWSQVAKRMAKLVQGEGDWGQASVTQTVEGGHGQTSSLVENRSSTSRSLDLWTIRVSSFRDATGALQMEPVSTRRAALKTVKASLAALLYRCWGQEEAPALSDLQAVREFVDACRELSQTSRA